QAPAPGTRLDTMRAGESCIARFLCGGSSGMPFPQARPQGTACAAHTIQHPGAW
ncbi:fructoselysine 6-kinase, partial [Escherichia coli]